MITKAEIRSKLFEYMKLHSAQSIQDMNEQLDNMDITEMKKFMKLWGVEKKQFKKTNAIILGHLQTESGYDYPDAKAELAKMNPSDKWDYIETMKKQYETNPFSPTPEIIEKMSKSEIFHNLTTKEKVAYLIEEGIFPTSPDNAYILTEEIYEYIKQKKSDSFSLSLENIDKMSKTQLQKLTRNDIIQYLMTKGWDNFKQQDTKDYLIGLVIAEQNEATGFGIHSKPEVKELSEYEYEQNYKSFVESIAEHLSDKGHDDSYIQDTVDSMDYETLEKYVEHIKEMKYGIKLEKVKIPRKPRQKIDYPKEGTEEVKEWFGNTFPSLETFFYNNMDKWKDRIASLSHNCKDKCQFEAEEEQKGKLKVHYDEVEKAIKGIVYDNNPIYRVIELCDIDMVMNDIDNYGIASYKSSDEGRKLYRNMGQYWSWDKHRAQAYKSYTCPNHKSPTTMLLKAHLPFKSIINPTKTIMTNIQYSGAEKEIRLNGDRIISLDYMCELRRGSGKNSCQKNTKRRISKYVRT